MPILGPLPFLIFIYDICTCINSSKLLFADDLKILREINPARNYNFDLFLNEFDSVSLRKWREIDVCLYKIVHNLVDSLALLSFYTLTFPVCVLEMVIGSFHITVSNSYHHFVSLII